LNTVFRLVNPVYDRNPYICKVNVFTQQDKYEVFVGGWGVVLVVSVCVGVGGVVLCRYVCV